jgi:hypothetical protein
MKKLVDFIGPQLTTLRNSILGKTLFGIVTVLAFGDSLFGYKFLPRAYDIFIKVDSRYLASIAFLILAAGIFVPRLPAVIRVILVFVSGAMFLPMMTMVGEPTSGKLVVVYDDQSKELYPPSFPYKAVDIQDVDKLAQVGEIKATTPLLSIVEQPEISWQKTFASGFKPNSNIFSLREITSDDATHFLDISGSNFLAEISRSISAASAVARSCVIYALAEYRVHAVALERMMRKQCPGNATTLIEYRDKQTGLIHPENAILVYIGSSKAFPSFFRHIVTSNYSLLLVPNWIAGEIDTNVHSPSSKHVLVVSSSAKKLASADFQYWSEVIQFTELARLKQSEKLPPGAYRKINDGVIHEIGFTPANVKR